MGIWENIFTQFNVCMSTNFRYKVPVYVLITEDAEEDWSVGVRH